MGPFGVCFLPYMSSRWSAEVCRWCYAQPWMSFVSVVLLLIVALNSWKGTLSSLYYATSDPLLSVEQWAMKTQPQDSSDPEKAIVSSEPSTPASISAAPVAIGDSGPPHPFAASSDVGDDREYVLDDEDRCQCRRASQNCQDSSTNSKIRSLTGTEGSSTLDYPRSPPRALRKDSQRRYYTHLTPLRTN